MAQEKCSFEEQAQVQNVDFFSRKSYPNYDVLVLNPEPTRRVYAAMTGETTPPSVNALYGICDRCNLCSPEIRPEGDGFRIFRTGYKNFVSNVPLATFTQFHAKSPKKRVRVVVIDDMSPEIRAQHYATEGIEALAVKVNPDRKPSATQERALEREVIEWGPDWVVSDKGLGYVNAINLILAFKEAGIRTIMYTGEEQTDITRRVADIFIQKASIRPEEMVKILTTPLA